MQQDEDEKVLVLATLLHDLGKVRVRHDNTKKHAEHGYDMIQEISRSSPEKKFMDRVAKLVLFHHSDPDHTDLSEEDKKLLKILKDADCKAAAHEREDREAPSQRDGPYLEKMTTYLSLKDVKEKDKKERRTFYVYPEKEIIRDTTGSSGRSGYKELDEEIIRDISRLNSEKFTNYIGSVNSILRNTTSYIPSAFYYSNPNIPLYDHLKMSGAIALCRYRSEKSNNSEFMLIRTDMSGIQDYIFKYFRSEQADDKGTRRIRGRSLRVSLTTRAIVQYIIDELKLYDLNVVWLNSDGSLIISPYSKEIEERLKKVRRDIEKYFIDHDRGMSCAIEWNIGAYDIIPAVNKDRYGESEPLDVEDSKFRSFMDELMNKVNKIKRQSNSDLIGEYRENFFVQEEIKPCWSCGLNERIDDRNCIECITEENIGSKIIRNEGSIILYKGVESELNFNFGDFLYSYSFGNREDKGESSRILYVNDYPNNIKDFQVPWEIFMIGNNVPTDEGMIITINNMLELKKKDSQRENFYLGIFKADVDNMGAIISDGFPRLTLPAYACFSRQINTFFTVIVNKISEKNGIYLIYSGGDDISALGPVDKIIEFSGMLHREFKDWMENEELTFSAGIATTHAKFPLRRGIDLAEDELEKSKMNEREKIKKDSITVFETTMKWEEFHKMTEFKKKMEKHIVDMGDIGKNFLQKLIKMDEDNPYKENNIKGKDLNFPDHIIYYYIERNWKGNEIDKTNLVKEIVNKENFRFIRYPATYILLEERM